MLTNKVEDVDSDEECDYNILQKALKQQDAERKDKETKAAEAVRKQNKRKLTSTNEKHGNSFTKLHRTTSFHFLLSLFCCFIYKQIVRKLIQTS